MRKLRFGKYEIHRVDALNVGIYKVMPDGTKPRTGSVRDAVSDDGKLIRHIGKFYGGYGAAARALHGILLAERIEDPRVLSVAEAIERAREEFRPLSEEIERTARAEEAAR